jgi:putative transcriptional regulator
MTYIFDTKEIMMYIKACKGGIFMKNKRMKIARMEFDIKQEDLAKVVGVARQTIGLLESGDYNPTLNLCIAICKALNRTLNDLFWEESI